MDIINAATANDMIAKAHGLMAEARYGEAERLFDQALPFASENSWAAFKSAELKLMRGAYLEAWPLYERRVMIQDLLQNIVWLIGLKRRGWDGSEMKDGTLLIYMEQGAGDHLLILRFLPEVMKRVGKIIVYTRIKELGSFLAQTLPGIQVVADESVPARLPFDAYILSMSLPALLKTTPDTIPAPPYVTADPQKTQQWRERLGGNLPLVGLRWQGNAQNVVDDIRSIRLGRFAPLLRTPKVRFVSLQTGPAIAQIDGLPPEYVLSDVSEDLKDWTDTAALINALDMVVSVDTGVAHMAGALDKELILISRYSPYWPWGATGSYTPWYPKAKVVRPAGPTLWDGAVFEAANLVAARFSS